MQFGGKTGVCDNLVYQYSKKQKRILISQDADFLDNKKFPITLTPGLVVIASKEAIEKLIANILQIIAPYPATYRQTKINMHKDSMKYHSFQPDGSLKIKKYRFQDKQPPEIWD